MVDASKPSAIGQEKLPGAAGRIAGNLHCAEHAFGTPWAIEISLQTMRAALDIAAVLSRHALAAFDLMGGNKALIEARKVWSWIERKQLRDFTFRDCFQSLRGSFQRAKDLEPAFEVLTERFYIAARPIGDGKPGRPPRIYDVNSSLTEQWSEPSSRD